MASMSSFIGESVSLDKRAGHHVRRAFLITAGKRGLAARERQTIILADVRSDPRSVACSPTVRSEIILPLLDEDHVLGVLDRNILDAFGPGINPYGNDYQPHANAMRQSVGSQCTHAHTGAIPAMVPVKNKAQRQRVVQKMEG